MKVILRKKVQNKTHNKALQLTSNTPLRSVLRSTELKRWALKERGEMNIRTSFQLLVLFTLPLLGAVALADDSTPFTNLVGITKVHEKMSVSLNIEGAEEFRVDPERVSSIVRKTLISAGVGADGSGIGVPMVSVSIAGQSTGGGGARYTVELIVRATIPSPFTKNRSVEAIFWRAVATSDEMVRYDPESKDFIKPSSQIGERVYGSVQEIASRLESDLKKANAGK